MPNEPASRFHPNSYRDYWPPPETDIEGGKFPVLMGTFMFLDTARIQEIGHTWNALGTFLNYEASLTQVKRWADYHAPEIGDSNVGTHTLRQTAITAVAISLDGDALGINPTERDLLVAAALIHDFGELQTTDVSYELKASSKRDLELAETQATFDMIDAAVSTPHKQNFLGDRHQLFTSLFKADELLANKNPEEMKARMKEIYLRITSSLNDDDVSSLIGKQTAFKTTTDWNKLRKMFALYERYGYLITAFQQWPYYGTDITELPAAEREMLEKWNRNELDAAIQDGSQVPEHIRKAIIVKNVLGHQWKAIQDADASEIPSARVFFNNDMTRRAVPQAIDALHLNIEPGFVIESEE